MAQNKIDKFKVYNLIANNLNWFGKELNLHYLPCLIIGEKISEALNDTDYKLSAATLTAMVHDGVLERKFVEASRCYYYRPILPIRDNYYPYLTL